MVTINVRLLTGFLKKSAGLIGKKHIEPVCFTTRWGIHTFGVLQPIDVVILDRNNRVVKMIQCLPPNRLFFWNPKYETVVELPAGTIAAYKITSGDLLKIKFTTVSG